MKIMALEVRACDSSLRRLESLGPFIVVLWFFWYHVYRQNCIEFDTMHMIGQEYAACAPSCEIISTFTYHDYTVCKLKGLIAI